LESYKDRPIPLYSVCVTCRNAVLTIERSLTSILSQLDERFEVIVVDGGSADGTVEILKRMQRKYKTLTVISYPCSRGLGRGIACRFARGKYLIQGGDTDLVFQPTLQSLVRYYHLNERIYEKYTLFIPGTFLISTRSMIDSIGGWPDLQYDEDDYLRSKLMRNCTLELNNSLVRIAIREHIESQRRGRLVPTLTNIVYHYVVWRDFHRVLPFAHMIELLRRRLREKAWFPQKLATVVMFFLGTLGQYSKTRYKLPPDDLQSYKKGEWIDMQEGGDFLFPIRSTRALPLGPSLRRFQK
jgi:glycosyltransferase involved in cell wall biosynthesis